MYIILDKSLHRIGMLSLDKTMGACPFWGDEIDLQIADDDSAISLDDVSGDNVSEFNINDQHANTKNWNHTLSSINVPYGYIETDMIKQGNSLGYYDETTSHWYIMRLTDVTDNVDASGSHYKSAVGVNLAIWDLGHTIIPKKTFTNGTVKEVFSSLLTGSSWIPGTIDMHGGNPQATLEFDGQNNAQSMLQTVCQTFDIEVDAYVIFNNQGEVVEKRLDILDQLGQDNGQFLRYGDNVTEMTRTVSDANLYTRLYPVSKNGDTIESINNGLPYVQDTAANDLYNTQLDVEGEKYLEGTITSSTISNLSALKTWANKQLKIFNHPRANYTITGSFTAGLGDRVKIQDLKMNPVLTVDSRVIQTKISQADPFSNQYVVGEFVTMKVTTPSLVDGLQSQLDNMSDILSELQENSDALKVNILTPDGTDFSINDQQKRAIAQVFVNSKNITNYIFNPGFVWQALNLDGTVNQDFASRSDNTDVGYFQTISDVFSGALRLSIDTDYLTDTLSIGTSDNVDTKITSNIANTSTETAMATNGSTIYAITSGAVLDMTNGTQMNINNLGSISIGVNGSTVYVINSYGQLVSFQYVSDGSVDLNTLNPIVLLTPSTRITYDADNDIFLLVDNGHYSAVRGVDILSGQSKALYYVDSNKSLGISDGIKSFSMDYPNIFLIDDKGALNIFNIINASPVFTNHAFGYSAGLIPGDVRAIACSDGKLVIDNAATPSILYPVILDNRQTGTVVVDNPTTDLVPTTGELSELQEVADKSAAVKKSDSTVIGLITDTHVDQFNDDSRKRSLHHIKTISYYAKNYGVDYLVHDGDLVHGDTSPKNKTKNDVSASMAAMNLAGVPYFVVKGNHDDASGYAKQIMNYAFSGQITPAEMYPLKLSKYKDCAVLSDDYMNPYGTLNMANNIALIFLNSFDGPYMADSANKMTYNAHSRSGFMQAQITWLDHTLHSIPDGTDVAVFVHSSLRGVFRGDNPAEVFADSQHGGNVVLDMLEAFNASGKYSSTGLGVYREQSNGSYIDEAENKAYFKSKASGTFEGHPSHRLIGVFSGHTHTDKLRKVRGFWNVETASSWVKGGNIKPRTIGDAQTEDAWDVITITPSTKDVSLHRYGAGKDRFFNYGG